MQDRAYVIAIVVVLAICCLGGAVAVTGYMNSNAVSNAPTSSNVVLTPLIIAVNTDTPAPVVAKSSVALVVATPIAGPSPIGAFQTIVAASTLSPTISTPAPVSVSSSASVKASSASASAIPTQVSCVGFVFCPKTGVADASLAPGGNACPRNYIWGRVADVTGKGIPGMRVRYQGPSGEYEVAVTKGSPDPAGAYNISAPPGSTWTIWLLDANGNDASPHIDVLVQAATSSGECATRRDFVQQK
jgi:hypothetical protein